jgi:hypothetical protein
MNSTDMLNWGSVSMSEIIWHWTKGEKKIYTRRTDLAEKALKDGILVMGVLIKAPIFE